MPAGPIAKICWRYRRSLWVAGTWPRCGATAPPPAVPAAPAARRPWERRARVQTGSAPLPPFPAPPPPVRRSAWWHSPSLRRCRFRCAGSCWSPRFRWRRLHYLFFGLVQAFGADGFMQCVRQYSQLPRYVWHCLPLVQQGLRSFPNFALKHRCRASPRRLEKALRTTFPQSLHVTLHRFRWHMKRSRDLGLTHRTVHHQLTGEQPERGQVFLRMLKNGQMPIQVGHFPVLAIKSQLGRNGSRTSRENRQLQLRHAPVSRLHNSLRKCNPGSIQFPRCPCIHGTRSGVLKLFSMNQKGRSTRAERLALPIACATKRNPKRSPYAAISGTGTISRPVPRSTTTCVLSIMTRSLAPPK